MCQDGNAPIKVRMVIDEPTAALKILEKRDAGKAIEDSDWKELFATEGYRRLKEREEGIAKVFKFKTPFTDESFKQFMLSPDLSKRRKALSDTFGKWQAVDVVQCAHRSLTYLPKGAKLHASVYFLIKPQANSFVWQIKENPAVMLYLDPDMSADELSMTIAHEFHHVGFESCCPSPEYDAWLSKQPEARQTAQMWLGGFGEGAAVLAAAGGPVDNPIAPAKKFVQDAWADGVAHMEDRMRELQQFFLDVLDGKLSKEKAQDKAGGFYGIQGPWYTVGYRIDSTIEKEFGREKLIECYLDPRKLLPRYNAAIRKEDAHAFQWSDELLQKLGTASER